MIRPLPQSFRGTTMLVLVVSLLVQTLSSTPVPLLALPPQTLSRPLSCPFPCLVSPFPFRDDPRIDRVMQQ
ncbi:hypothetical protein EXIGLDRAFT_737203 [Exidia glandulosa HHB12029]|uniref:Secreted protein n=1 Tax=Exidia glandulosa HHB12029 TaxID=1314781 RepID=A0A166N034_EXIGL|nr:hypothetical protein EXIGLDRAFT_737203 [Exidia glandulosa HHB12029]